jgi:hypothetical protein
LCTMYDSYGVYLCVLWTICMYKFNRCHIVVFTVFSFHERRFSGGGGTGRISVFLIFTSAFQPNFLDFHRFLSNFKKPTRSVSSNFPNFAEFLNTAHNHKHGLVSSTMTSSSSSLHKSQIYFTMELVSGTMTSSCSSSLSGSAKLGASSIATSSLGASSSTSAVTSRSLTCSWLVIFYFGL